MSHLTEVLNSTHEKTDFSCGKNILDNYFIHQASKDVKRKSSACFGKVDSETGHIQGYYTLANSSIPLHLVPAEFQITLHKSYVSIPATLLGRLAIALRYQGKGIGKLLLVDALYRSYDNSKHIGSFAVVVDLLDKEAENFYIKYGFIKLPDSDKMFLAMKTIKDLF
ncbi:MAG: GNAT family N-acetyltransferase [Bacteroidota bacterium]